MQEHKIDYRFKILYAVATVMILISHGGGGIPLDVGGMFPYYTVHLSLFAFSSGYFYKAEAENACGKYILKKTKKLIVPLFITTWLYGLFVQLTKLKGFEIGGEINVYNMLIAPIIDGSQFRYNMCCWFVVPLFLIEVYQVLSRKLLRLLRLQPPEALHFAFDLLLGIAGIQLAISGRNLGWWVPVIRMLYLLPFYSLGVFYRSDLEKYEKKISSTLWFTVILLSKLVIIYLLKKSPEYTPSWGNDYTDGPIMPFLVGFLGVAFWLRISQILCPVIGKSRIINKISDASYSVMVNQFLGFMIVKAIFGLLSSTCGIFTDFNWVSFKTDIWYYYLPYGLSQFRLLYMAGGLLVPIALHELWKRIKHLFRKKQKT